MSHVEVSHLVDVPGDPPELDANRYEAFLRALEDLERWMSDTLRRGLAEARDQPPEFWEARAARMTDAKLPGVASMLRRIALLPTARADWPEITFSLLCRLQLLSDALRRLPELPPDLQHDVLTLLGQRQLKKELAQTRPALEDEWTVLGTRRREEDVFVTDATWLHGRRTGRLGLLLEFTPRARVPETPAPAGCVLRGEVVYYLGAVRQRVFFKQDPERVDVAVSMPKTRANFQGCAETFSRQLSKNPWLESSGMAIDGARLMMDSTDCHLVDQCGRRAPLDPEFEGLWKFLAVSAESFIPLFGEWTGFHFTPISLFTDDGIINLDPHL
jgi:hypothetical protein